MRNVGSEGSEGHDGNNEDSVGKEKKEPLAEFVVGVSKTQRSAALHFDGMSRRSPTK